MQVHILLENATLVGVYTTHEHAVQASRRHVLRNFRIETAPVYGSLYKATWGEGYTRPGSKFVTLEEITEANGWDPVNIEALTYAQPGQVIDCSCISGVLHVERIL